MIVLCPSCNTRYRHDPGEHATASTAECSRCDERFPIEEVRRTYVLVPPVRPPASIGMDDPSLAPRIVTAADAALSERILSGAGVADLPPVEDGLAGYELPETEERPAATRSALVEFLIAVIPPSAGASLAYYLASRDQLDPVAWSALGGAAGFLLGWGCLLWIRRKD